MTAVRSIAASPANAPTPGSGPPGPRLSPLLAAELERGPWGFPWRLAPGLVPRVDDPGARHAAWTLERMLERPLGDALAMATEGATALDLECAEGWLGHRLLEWGATRVLGLESRPERLRRAELVREHLALPARALELRGIDDLIALDPDALGTFEVISLVGTVDVVDDIPALIRRVRPCARNVLVIETDGRDSDAVAAAAREVGFESVLGVEPPADGERRYLLGERILLLARPKATS